MTCRSAYAHPGRQQRSLSSAQNSISATSSPSFTSHAYGTASPGRTESTPPSSRMSIADTLPSPPHFADVPVLQDPAPVNFARRSISAQDAHAEGRRQSSASGRASHVAPRLSIQTDGQDRRSSAASMAWVTGGVGKGPGSTNLPRTRSEADLLAQDELGMPAPSPYPHAKSAGVNPPDSALPTAYVRRRLLLRGIGLTGSVVHPNISASARYSRLCSHLSCRRRVSLGVRSLCWWRGG